MPGALAARLTLALTAVLLLLALLTGLVLEAVRGDAERELREGRFVYTLAQLQQRVETPLALGLGMESQAFLQQQLEAEVAADPEILSIDLFDAEGRLLHSTDGAGIRDAVPEGWLQALQALPEPAVPEQEIAAAVWRVPERGGQALGVALRNDFGLEVGGLALRHAVAEIGDEVLRADSLALTLRLLALAVAAGLLGGLGFWLLCRPLDREAAALAATLADPGAAAPASAPEKGPGAEVARLLEALRRAERRCAAAAAEVERIDARG